MTRVDHAPPHGAAPPVSHAHFPALDGYRAIAAFMVLTTHVAFTSGEVLAPVIGPVLSRFDFGVTVFFILSGFLLYRPWALAAMTARAGPRVGRYLWRRAMRIFPAYWAVVVFTLLVLPEIRPVAARTWPEYLGLVHIYLSGNSVEGLTQVWSLATEVAFYLALPVIAWAAGLRGRGDPDRSARFQLWVLTALCLAALTFNLGRTVGPLSTVLQAGYWLPGYVDWFAIGMAFAVLSARTSLPAPPRRLRNMGRMADDTVTSVGAGVAVFLIACTPIAGPYIFELGTTWGVVLKHYLYAIAAALLLAPGLLGHQHLGRWRGWLSSPVAAYLGRISYGVFLWHLVLLRLIVTWLDLPLFGGQFLLLWVLTASAATAVAALSWRVLEAPLQRLSHRWPRPRRSSPAPAAR